MKKILIIIKREYLSRVKKKSFIIMTVLGPLLMAALFVVPIYLANISDQKREIAVIDETGIFSHKLPSDNNVVFEDIYMSYEAACQKLDDMGYDAVLYIPEQVINNPNIVKMTSRKEMGMLIVGKIESVIEQELEAHRLAISGIDKNILKEIKVDVKLNTFTLKEGAEERSNSTISYVLGFIGGILIYMFIYLYGNQVMRGVIEEKTSRIVEVIVSSVKPFQLMMGKIIGVALVSITQFILWITLTAFLVIGIQQINPELFKYKMPDKTMVENKGLTQSEMESHGENISLENSQTNQVLKDMSNIQVVNILVVFVLFFLLGYLLYASMFAAIGSIVDNEADTQQFLLPITVPLIIALISLNFVLNNPDGPVAFWLSMIPFTSPIMMVARVPFNPPVALWEVALSLFLLIVTFLIITWLAAKIYRTGILMYGKKISVRELFKWLKY